MTLSSRPLILGGIERNWSGVSEHRRQHFVFRHVFAAEDAENGPLMKNRYAIREAQEFLDFA